MAIISCNSLYKSELFFDNFSKKINSFNAGNLEQSVAGVYIGCNETETENIQHVLEDIKINGGCHIGFSSWYNFDIMVIRQSERGILCDFNPETRKFINISLAGAVACPNRFAFVDGINKYVGKFFCKFSPNVKNGVCITADEEVEGELTREGSWLSSDESFSYIKKLAREGKISVITEDIRNDDLFRKIAKILQDNSISIDTVYLSNIGEYMLTEKDKDKFINTVRSLCTYETKFIYSKLVDSNQKLIQLMLNGSDFLQEKIGIKELFTIPSSITVEDVSEDVISKKYSTNPALATVEDIDS
jgi:hypothetical protein